MSAYIAISTIVPFNDVPCMPTTRHAVHQTSRADGPVEPRNIPQRKKSEMTGTDVCVNA